MSDEEMDITNRPEKLWNDETIGEFIELYAQHRPLSKFCTSGQLFELISKQLAEICKLNIDAEQLSRKFNNLVRTFRKTKNHQKFPYHKRLKEILESPVVDHNFEEQAVNFLKGPTNNDVHILDLNVEEVCFNQVENNNWSALETSHMLKLLKKNHQKFKNNSKKSFWQFLAYKLNQDGFRQRSVDNVSRKFVNLQRSFRFAMSRNNHRSSSKFQFLEDMKEIQDLLKKSEDNDLSEPDEDSDCGVDELINQSKIEIAIESKVKRLWTEHETSIFIQILKDLDPATPNKWQLTSQKLRQENIFKTPDETCRKLCNLKRTFRKSSQKSLRFPFYDEVKLLVERELVEVESSVDELDYTNCAQEEEVDEPKIEKLKCKFCLADCDTVRPFHEDWDVEMLKMIHYLFDDQNFNPNKTNLICFTCETKVHAFYSFKKQFEKATGFCPKIEPQNSEDELIIDPDIGAPEEIIECQVNENTDQIFELYNVSELIGLGSETSRSSNLRKNRKKL